MEERTVSNIVNFYLKIKSVCKTQLCDGVGHKPSFSLRTLCRALGIASRNKCKNVSRSLFEAFSICFLTELDRESYPLVLGLIYKYIHNNEKLSVSHGLTLGGDSKR